MNYEPVLSCGCSPDDRLLCNTGLASLRDFHSTGDVSALERLAKHLRITVKEVRGLVAPASRTRI